MTGTSAWKPKQSLGLLYMQWFLFLCGESLCLLFFKGICSGNLTLLDFTHVLKKANGNFHGTKWFVSAVLRPRQGFSSQESDYKGPSGSEALPVTFERNLEVPDGAVLWEGTQDLPGAWPPPATGLREPWVWPAEQDLCSHSLLSGQDMDKVFRFCRWLAWRHVICVTNKPAVIT